MKAEEIFSSGLVDYKHICVTARHIQVISEE